MYRLLIASAATALVMAPGALHAESELQPTVRVELADMRAALAAQLDLPEPLVPREVAVPVADAAEICGVDASELARNAESGDITCTAVRGSPELTRAVDAKIVITGGPEGERLPGGGPTGGVGAEEDAAGTDILPGEADEPGGALPNGAEDAPDTRGPMPEDDPERSGTGGADEGEQTPGTAPSELRERLGPTTGDTTSPDGTSPGTAGDPPPPPGSGGAGSGAD